MAQGWRREGRQACLPGGVRVGQLDDSAIDARDAADDVGVAPGKLEDHVATPRLTGQDRPSDSECLDQGSQVANGDVVSVFAVGRVRAPVTALIEGDDRVAT